MHLINSILERHTWNRNEEENLKYQLHASRCSLFFPLVRLYSNNVGYIGDDVAAVAVAVATCITSTSSIHYIYSKFTFRIYITSDSLQILSKQVKCKQNNTIQSTAVKYSQNTSICLPCECVHLSGLKDMSIRCHPRCA